MTQQYGFYYDQSRCSGCKTCVVACKDWNDVKPGPANWRRVTIVEQGTFPEARGYNLSLGCNHCENPACMTICPVNAISKRTEDGVVLVDRNVCIACQQCGDACPFGAPQYGDDQSEPVKQKAWNEDHPMQKCTSCWDRRAVGKDPACVAGCMQRALDFGPLHAMEAKHPKSKLTVVGLPSDRRSRDGEAITPTNPSIRFKKK